MMTVVKVNSYTTQAIVWIVNNTEMGKRKLEQEYCDLIKNCYSSYISNDSTYAIVKTNLGDIELMLGYVGM